MTDVRAKTMTGTAAASVGPCRVRAIYYVCGAATGSISFKRGGASGAELLNFATPAGVTITGTIDIPSDGLWFIEDPYVTLSNITSMTFFYG